MIERLNNIRAILNSLQDSIDMFVEYKKEGLKRIEKWQIQDENLKRWLLGDNGIDVIVDHVETYIEDIEILIEEIKTIQREDNIENMARSH